MTNDTDTEKGGHPERGAILVLTALALVILMAMAAFAIDYGWIAWNRLEARKAAEAAALAGVVHMPLEGAATLSPGEEAYDVALDVAKQAGYDASLGGVSVIPAETTNAAQLQVTVSGTVNTFFMKVFGRNPVTVTETAIAEQLPPLKIGGDQPNLGNVNNADDEGFWVGIRGVSDSTALGDPWTPAGIPHYYAIDVPEGASGTLTVNVFDGINHQRQCGVVPPPPGLPTCESRFLETGDNDNSNSGSLTFTLYRPDSTPNSWTDNSVAVCARSFGNTSSYTDPLVNSTRPLLNISSGGPNCGAATSGIYVLKLTHTSNNNNNYSISASLSGSGQPAVYGLGSMTLYMNELNSTPELQIVRLDGIYAGTELVISAFDTGDVDLGSSCGGCSATMEFTGAFAGMDCEVQTRNAGSAVGTGYVGDSSYPGGFGAGTCGIAVKTNTVNYGDKWVDFRFTIPSSYTCDSTSEDCWGTVQFNFPPGVYPWDTTTWTATINGTPIHLEPTP